MRVEEVVHLPELSLGACGLGTKPGVVVDVIEGQVAKHEARSCPNCCANPRITGSVLCRPPLSAKPC
jgi:hypothetical protein